MEQIVSFCDKTTEEKAIKNKDNESILKQQMENRGYEQIKKAITSNEAATKKILHQRKFKKYNSLKYKTYSNYKSGKMAEKTVNT